MNRLILLTEPLDKQTKYTYTSSGQVKTTTKPDGVVLTNAYDLRGNLISSGGYAYTYDAMGNLLSVGDVNRTYTPRGFLASESYLGHTFLYVYDDLNRITEITFPDDSTVKYLYNPTGITKVKRKGYEHTYLDFDLFGNPTIEQLIDGSIRTKSCDELGRLKTISHPDFSLTLTYDEMGNLLQSGPNTYTYNKLNQLTSESGRIYFFDSIDNPRHQHTLNALNQITSDKKYLYTYDLNGNLKTRSGATIYAYDSLDRLISVNDTHQYTYDGLHRRLLKKTPDGEELYWYIGDNEIASFSNDSLTFRALGRGFGAEIGAAVLIEQKGEILTPHHDQSGNLVHLGRTSCTYSAFGEASTSLSPWGFASKRFDPETGFSNFGRRFYDPELMRWINPDPKRFDDGPNLYAYLHNRPLNDFDLYGLWSLSTLWEGTKNFSLGSTQYLGEIGCGMGHSMGEMGRWMHADFQYEHLNDPSLFHAKSYSAHQEWKAFGHAAYNDPLGVALPGFMEAWRLPSDAPFSTKARAWGKGFIDAGLIALPILQGVRAAAASTAAKGYTAVTQTARLVKAAFTENYLDLQTGF